MRRVGWDERNVGLLIHNFITHPILVSRVCFFCFFHPFLSVGFIIKRYQESTLGMDRGSPKVI